MSTLKPTLEELEAIKKAINSGVLETTIDGRTVVYRNLEDMVKIRDRMEEDLGVFNKHLDTLDDITEGTENKHFTAAEKKKLADIDADELLLSPVQNVPALKAIDTTDPEVYPDKVMINVEDAGLYRLDRQSTADGDANRVVEPNQGIGRWLKMSAAINDHDNLSNIKGHGTLHIDDSEQEKIAHLPEDTTTALDTKQDKNAALTSISALDMADQVGKVLAVNPSEDGYHLVLAGGGGLIPRLTMDPIDLQFNPNETRTLYFTGEGFQPRSKLLGLPEGYRQEPRVHSMGKASVVITAPETVAPRSILSFSGHEAWYQAPEIAIKTTGSPIYKDTQIINNFDKIIQIDTDLIDTFVINNDGKNPVPTFSSHHYSLNRWLNATQNKGQIFLNAELGNDNTIDAIGWKMKQHGAQLTANRLQIYWNDEDSLTKGSCKFCLKGSNDGETWTTLLNVDRTVNYEDPVKNYAFPSASYQYWQIHFKTQGSGKKRVFSGYHPHSSLALYNARLYQTADELIYTDTQTIRMFDKAIRMDPALMDAFVAKRDGTVLNRTTHPDIDAWANESSGDDEPKFIHAAEGNDDDHAEAIGWKSLRGLLQANCLQIYWNFRQSSTKGTCKFWLKGSNDGESWSEVLNVDDTLDAKAEPLQEYLFPQLRYRYWKLQFKRLEDQFDGDKAGNKLSFFNARLYTHSEALYTDTQNSHIFDKSIRTASSILNALAFKDDGTAIESSKNANVKAWINAEEGDDELKILTTDQDDAAQGIGWQLLDDKAHLQVNRLQIYWTDTKSPSDTQGSCKFVLQGSNDGTDWTPLLDNTTTTDISQPKQTYSFETSRYSYWRVHFKTIGEGSERQFDGFKPAKNLSFYNARLYYTDEKDRGDQQTLYTDTTLEDDFTKEAQKDVDAIDTFIVKHNNVTLYSPLHDRNNVGAHWLNDAKSGLFTLYAETSNNSHLDNQADTIGFKVKNNAQLEANRLAIYWVDKAQYTKGSCKFWLKGSTDGNTWKTILDVDSTTDFKEPLQEYSFPVLRYAFWKIQFKISKQRRHFEGHTSSNQLPLYNARLYLA